MNTLSMEVRTVNETGRTVTGVVAPYDEITYLVGDPGGERIRRGAFAKSLRNRETRVPLFVGHNHSGAAVGMSTGWRETPEGLVGSFRIKAGPVGDETLADVSAGMLPSMSVGFRPTVATRGADGAAEVHEANLLEVSLVGVAAYAGAEVMSVRAAAHRRSPVPPAPPGPRYRRVKGGFLIEHAPAQPIMLPRRR